MNAPIQGTAADIIKVAMIRVAKRLKEEQLKTRLLLQVHDELLLEVPEDELEKAEKILEEEMTGAAHLAVKLEIDMHTGNNWYEAKSCTHTGAKGYKRMKVFGITGGVGAGKSEVLTYLGQNYDATVIQADEAGYLVMLPGGECYGEIVKLFGRQITTETGELDRKRIAEIVFQDEEKLKALNAIVHPAVKRYIKKAIAAAEKAGTEYVFVEAALLIEEKYDEICDELWYIYADEEVRKERLIEGRGYSEKKVLEIMANQLSEDEFSSHCDFEIDNSGDFEETKKQLDHRMKKYETL